MLTWSTALVVVEGALIGALGSHKRSLTVRHFHSRVVLNGVARVVALGVLERRWPRWYLRLCHYLDGCRGGGFFNIPLSRTWWELVGC